MCKGRNIRMVFWLLHLYLIFLFISQDASRKSHHYLSQILYYMDHDCHKQRQTQAPVKLQKLDYHNVNIFMVAALQCSRISDIMATMKFG